MSARRMSRTRSAQSRIDDSGGVFVHAGQSSQRGHSRKPSNATTASRSTVSPSKRDRRGRARMVRDSLLGAQVHAMTVDQRAELLAGVAGDCVVKVLAVGFDKSHESSEQADQTWTTFQALRKTYFFGDDAPSIIFYKDIIHLLPTYTTSNHQALARAVELCNLATFAYIIFKPDYAGRLATGSKISRKGKGRARDPALVKKRNAVLLDVWEKYWQIIPESEKASEEAIRMWLAFATQSFEVDPSSGSDSSLETPSGNVWSQMFSPSAVARFGRWDLPGSQLTDGSGIDGMTQEIVEGRWAKAIAIRSKEVGTLLKRYPYDEFRRDMFAYLDSNVVGAGAYFPNNDAANESSTDLTDGDHSSSATERAPLPVTLRRSLRHRRRSTTARRTPGARLALPDDEPEPGVLADKEEDTDMETAEASMGQTGHEEMIDDEAFDQQMLADVVREMESENSLSQSHYVRRAPRREARHRSVTATPNKRRRGHGEADDGDWMVQDGLTPRALTAPPVRNNVFNFASRQTTAVQLEWDSQTPGPNHADLVIPSVEGPGGQDRPSVFDGDSDRLEVPASSPAPRQDDSVDAKATPRRSRGPLFPFRGQRQASSTGGEESIPIALREASVPLVTDDGFVEVNEEEEAVEESQDKPYFDAPEHLRPDSDTDGDELLPAEVLSRRFMPHNDMTPRRTTEHATVTHTANDIEEQQPDESSITAFHVSGRVPEPSQERHKTDDRSSDDGSDLLPPEIRVQTQGSRGRDMVPGTVQTAEIAMEGLLNVDAEIELLLGETAERAATSGPGRDRSGATVNALSDNEMDGNELLPIEAVRGDRPKIIGSTPSGRATTTLDHTASNAGALPADTLRFEQVPLQNTMSDPPTSSVLLQTSSDAQRNQIAPGHYPEDGFAGDYDPYMEEELGEPLRRTGSGTPRDVDEYGFVIANRDEAEEDRLLLEEIDQNRAARQVSSQLVDVKPFGRLLPPARARSRSQRIPEIDLYTVDDDGGPLQTDEAYRIPPDHVARSSRLHGQVAGQSSAYSRLSGKKRWTDEQALLLYRTLQKVPLDVWYPLRVVWHLHGEHGEMSQQLEDFNPQHMKDKMVTILRTRTNNRLPVEGRARMYLPKTDARREQYDQELADWEAERKRADRAARDELDRLEAERLAAEESDSEEEMDGAEEEEEVDAEGRDDNVRTLRRSSRRQGVKKGNDITNHDENSDDGDDDGDEDQDDDDNDDGDDDPGNDDDANDGTYGSRGDLSASTRRTRSGGQRASQPSTRSARATRALQRAKSKPTPDPASQSAKKRGRPRKVPAAVEDGNDGASSVKHKKSRPSKSKVKATDAAEVERADDGVDTDPPSNASSTLRSSSARSRLQAEVVLPSSRTRSKTANERSTQDPSPAQKVKRAAKTSRTAKTITKARTAKKPKKQDQPRPLSPSESDVDSEREIDGLIDEGHLSPEKVGMPLMSDLESEEGDGGVSITPHSFQAADIDDGDEAGDVNGMGEEVVEGETETDRADREAEDIVRRRMVQQKVLNGE